MAERSVSASHHVVEQGFLQLTSIVLLLKLDEVRLLDLDLEHATRFFEGLVHRVSCLEIAATTASLGLLVDEEPLTFGKVNCLLNRQSSKNLLIDVDDVILTENLRGSQNCALDRRGDGLELDAPVLDRLLHRESLEHLLDLVHALLG